MKGTGEIRVTILGCGSSGGVPRFGGEDGDGEWGACDPIEPKNRRTRCSVLVQRAHPEFGFQHDKVTTILVDTSPDMRHQMLMAKCTRIDAVLYTHDHADQVHGIDDLRIFALSGKKRIPVYIDDRIGGSIVDRFDYCFEQKVGSYYPPILERREMPVPGAQFSIAGLSGEIPVMPFLQDHGGVDSLGFRFGGAAYSSDVVELSDASFELLSGLDVWIVDALQYNPHPTHAHVDKTLGWIERAKPKRAVLTNMHVHIDYQTLRRALPDGIEPAFDGMSIRSHC